MSLEIFEITFTPGSASEVQGALSIPFYIRWGHKQGVGEFRLPLSLERLDALIEFLQVCQDLPWAREVAERPDVADAIRVLMMGPEADDSTNRSGSATEPLILPSAADCIRRIGKLLFRLFRSCRGKHMFSYLVLARHKAMRYKRHMTDTAEKRGELICAVLMR
jgi:hypothetical protein